MDPMILAALMQSMVQLPRINNKQEEDSDLVQGGKAHRRLHRMKRKVEERPLEVINTYLADVRLRLGAEPTDPWQLWHMTENIAWGNQLGLRRCHHYVSHAVGHILHGREEVGTALLCQLLRAIHQASLEKGEWGTAC